MKFDQFSIRRVEITDLQDYFDLIQRNRARLEDFFAGTVALTKNLEDTKAHLKDVIAKAERKNYFPFVVVDIATNKIISSIQVKSVDWSIPKAELGYYIDSAYEGKGIVATAISFITHFCFEELKFEKLYIRTHEENVPSRKVAEKNGFELEGIIRLDYKTTSGRVVDLMYYGLLRENYLLRKTDPLSK
jgi:RimJ/RimL family protein N-acetyltransferase